MEDMNTINEDVSQYDEDELFLKHVVQNDHELYYLDVCMSEICRQQQESGS